MNAEVMAAHAWPTNGHMIADVARLGYIEGSVLDVTYGDGTFWREWRPEQLTTNDLFKPADFAYDYLYLPHSWTELFDTVVFDPPYKLNGTPTGDAQDRHFGTDRKATTAERFDELVFGVGECWRVTRKWLLVKCQDQVAGGKVRWHTDAVTARIGVQHKVDEFHFQYQPRPQPGNRGQQHARRNYSTLLVFAKPGLRKAEK